MILAAAAQVMPSGFPARKRTRELSIGSANQAMVGAQGDIVARCCAWVSPDIQVLPYCGVLVLSPQIQALVNVHRPISMQCVNRPCLGHGHGPLMTGLVTTLPQSTVSAGASAS
jgi:hypothetical protein